MHCHHVRLFSSETLATGFKGLRLFSDKRLYEGVNFKILSEVLLDKDDFNMGIGTTKSLCEIFRRAGIRSRTVLSYWIFGIESRTKIVFGMAEGYTWVCKERFVIAKRMKSREIKNDIKIH